MGLHGYRDAGVSPADKRSLQDYAGNACVEEGSIPDIPTMGHQLGPVGKKDEVAMPRGVPGSGPNARVKKQQWGFNKAKEMKKIQIIIDRLVKAELREVLKKALK